MAIAEGAVVAEDNRRRLTQDNHLQLASRNGGAVCRPARGGRQYRRDRPPLLLFPEEVRNPILPRFAARDTDDSELR